MTETLTSLSCLTDEDRAFYDREIASFLPDKIFDAHTHLWLGGGYTHFRLATSDGDVGFEEYVTLMQDLHPNRKRWGALFIPFASPARPDGLTLANDWVTKHANKHPDCRGEFFVRPEDDPEWVRQEVRRRKLHGLKCYHTFCSAKPTWEGDIPQYLPERLIKVADEEGWFITLHIVKSRAAADPVNIHWIRHYCETYPNMKLILAHSARGFQPAHNLEGLPKLRGLPNLYFDTSVNCEPIAHQAIIRIIGHDKLMYGTDLPVSHDRGTQLGAADSFLWLTENSPVWSERHLNVKPVLVGLEHLRSIKWACWSERLTDSQVEDIFWNNAARLFGLR